MAGAEGEGNTSAKRGLKAIVSLFFCFLKYLGLTVQCHFCIIMILEFEFITLL